MFLYHFNLTHLQMKFVQFVTNLWRFAQCSLLTDLDNCWQATYESATSLTRNTRCPLFQLSGASKMNTGAALMVLIKNHVEQVMDEALHLHSKALQRLSFQPVSTASVKVCASSFSLSVYKCHSVGRLLI